MDNLTLIVVLILLGGWGGLGWYGGYGYGPDPGAPYRGGGLVHLLLVIVMVVVLLRFLGVHIR